MDESEVIPEVRPKSEKRQAIDYLIVLLRKLDYAYSITGKTMDKDSEIREIKEFVLARIK